MCKLFLPLLAFLFISINSHASENSECQKDNLDVLDITFYFENDKSEFTGKIYLPDIQTAGSEFCGYWLQNKLTNGVLKQYKGYKYNTVILNLSPDIHDAGLAIEFQELTKWSKEGVLSRKSIAGFLPLGKFKLTKQ